MLMRSIVLLAISVSPLLAGEAPWSTYRGNNRRTGNTDNIAGPAKPAILWFQKSADHYVSSPIPTGTDVVFPGLLGGFNSGVVKSFPLVPKDPKTIKPTWIKRSPLIRLPTFSSPAVTDGKIIFGDGMHVTDGATLYCFPSDGGYLLWACPCRASSSISRDRRALPAVASTSAADRPA